MFRPGRASSVEATCFFELSFSTSDEVCQMKDYVPEGDLTSRRLDLVVCATGMVPAASDLRCCGGRVMVRFPNR